MTCVVLAALVAGGLAYTAFAVSTMIQFFAYCNEVALATGRAGEHACLRSGDDGGINAFQREQLRLLNSGEFMLCGDATLVARGRVVARNLRISFWVAAGLVLSVAVAELWAS